MVEFHMAAEGLREGRLFFILDAGAEVLIIEELFGGGRGLRQHIDEVAKHPHGAGDHPDVAGERNQRAQRQRPADDHRAADAQQQRRAEAAQKVQHRHIVRPDVGRAQQQGELLAVLDGEGFFFVLLLRKRLDHAHAGDIFLRLGRKHRVLLTDVLERLVDLFAEADGDKSHDGRDAHHDQCQLPVDEKQEDQRAEKPDRVFADLHDAAGQQVAQAFNIARHAGHDLANVVGVVKVVAHLAQVPVKPRAQIKAEVLRQLFKRHAADIVAHRAQHGKNQYRAAQRHQLSHLSALDDVVHHPARNQRQNQAGGVGSQQRDKADQGKFGVGTAHSGDAFEHFHETVYLLYHRPFFSFGPAWIVDRSNTYDKPNVKIRQSFFTQKSAFP